MQVRVSDAEEQKILFLRDHGFSLREVLEIVFDNCNNFPITIQSKKNGAPIQIPHNLLCQKKK